MSLPYNKNLISRAKGLRRDMTRQEKRLWYDFLAKYPVRFQRQKTIDNYIADFYCAKARLIVELDGSHHYTEAGLEYDDIRTKVLNAYDVEVIRFCNRDVDTNFVGVCQSIEMKINERIFPLGE